MDNLAQQRWFTEEVLPHESALKAYLVHKFPGLREVDDLVQESYLRLLKAHRQGRVRSVKAYLFTIARNAAITQLRAPHRFQVYAHDTADLEDVTVDASDAAREVSKQDEIDILAEAIANLPIRCREVFTCVKLQGLSYQETAVHLGLSGGTVHVQVSRGLKKCADHFRERGLLGDKET